MADVLFTLSEIEIRYKPKVPALQKPRILCSQDAYAQFMLIFDLNLINVKEEAAVLFLNNGNRVLGAWKASSGGITATVVDKRIILATALKCLATCIVLAHTHPSGELKPSRTDIELTRSLKEACQIMDISLLDHLIVTTETFYSFAEERIL